MPSMLVCIYAIYGLRCATGEVVIQRSFSVGWVPGQRAFYSRRAGVLRKQKDECGKTHGKFNGVKLVAEHHNPARTSSVSIKAGAAIHSHDEAYKMLILVRINNTLASASQLLVGALQPESQYPCAQDASACESGVARHGSQVLRLVTVRI